MDQPVDLEHALASAAEERGLHRGSMRDAGWVFWELRTLNRHRVVGLLRRQALFPGLREVEAEIRDTVARHFKRAWWRGMAYGVVVEVPGLSLTAENIESLIDVRDNRRGTLQWVFLIARSTSAAIGVHTWIEGYLSPVYRSVLQKLEDGKFDVTTLTKEKDGLMTVLSGAADLHSAISTFNVKQKAFAEFRERS